MTLSVTGDNIQFPDLSVQDTAATGFGFKNRIINGDMRIDQRNAGASVTPTGFSYTVDRWAANLTQSSKFSVQQSTTASTGQSKALVVTSLAATSVASGDFFAIQHIIEGYNIADFGFGTAGAQPITLSFSVRSSLTGTFGGCVTNGAHNRSYPFTFTISTANTFEQKTVTIAGDTAGTWATDNTAGLRLWFGLGAGSTYSGTAGTWAGSALVSATGATSVVGTSGATFYITGVQLEKGSTATSFDYRDYGRELIMCQRYYQKSFPIAIAPIQNSGLYTLKWTQLTSGYGTRFLIQFVVAMRGTPTITGFNGGNTNNLVRNVPAATDITIIGFEEISAASFCLLEYGGTGDNMGAPVGWNWTASAEL